MIIEAIFPTPLAITKSEFSLTEEQKDFLINQKRCENTGNTSSEDTYILKHDVVSNLRDWLQSQVNEYVERIEKPKNDVELYITQSWVNWTQPGQFHHKHSHLNSLISGVFYIDVSSETDKIHFFKMAMKQLDFGPRKEYNEFNCEEYFYPIESNMLVLFPSSLQHHVEKTINNTETRISLAFNTFARGILGTDDTMTGLHLS